MGHICSNPEKDDVEEKNAPPTITRKIPSRRLQKATRQQRLLQINDNDLTPPSHSHQPYTSHPHPLPYFLRRITTAAAPSTLAASLRARTHHDMEQAQKMIDAQDAIVKENGGAAKRLATILDAKLQPAAYPRTDVKPPRSASSRAAAVQPPPPTTFRDETDYEAQRRELIRREGTIAFDFKCTALAQPLERRANEILQVLRHNDDVLVYRAAPPREGFGGQLHRRFAGDHFLSNVDLIAKTELFRVATRMPKGAHLHIHFNACLLPHVLLDIAKSMDRMFITSDLPLLSDNDYINYSRCEIQFSILTVAKEKPGNLFDRAYEPRQTMKFKDFLDEFPTHYNKSSVETWLENKLVFSEEEAHSWLQTVLGSWEKFNGRTRMMKGLFNYVSAYRRYTRLCLEEFVRDNIQYAEIRPNFMKTNQVWSDDGSELIDNVGIMTIIMEEYKKFQAETQGYFGGLKIIYCTPRSFSNELVAHALKECIEFKKRWPEWIAGFDLVGEEAKGKPLREFVPEFLDFRKQCEAEGLEIPFLFHCGETLEMGSETDGNLVDALLLNAKRIGHGFALARHPYIMEHMKKRGMCLELCPISNEILGLTPRVSGHAMYNLLANNVHCTVSSDNGTLFNCTLSHDFYQVMIGKSDMTLHGWRQLIEWSFEHSCMSDDEKRPVVAKWEQLWDIFLRWIVETYGHVQRIEA